ncbi:hypothetical protein L596_002966 [Steinernema carpocapsae]|uniref:Membrane transporter protein n=1 Tax=Steinernema carpocapsae TaxID=34508 RepID=A0A4U8UUX1_STECR|nr:hypothetical protein L596_002966 [Steinernema carpocapsae]
MPTFRVPPKDVAKFTFVFLDVQVVMNPPALNQNRRSFTKYFFEGQELEEGRIEELKTIPEDASFDQKILIKYRKFIAFLIPFTVAQVWNLSKIRLKTLPLYSTHWQMPLTMIFGATVAGMTSEGGGAVAFPVMTFVLKIDPKTARDFSLMIQTVGMSMSLFVIIFMRIQIEWRAIIMATFGAIPGVVIGFTFFDPLFTPAVKKMMFVSIWCSFAIALWILNRQKKRPTNVVIQNFCLWKAFVLFLTGFVGGIFNSFAGSGVDICVFSVITLLFRVSEKTATPTTVVLMGLNSQFGFFWRAVMEGNIDQLAWDTLKVCAPVVVTFAPLGSFLGSHFHRLILASFIYFVEIFSLVGFLFTKPHWTLVVTGGFIVCFGLLFFSCLSRIGQVMVDRENKSQVTKDELEEFITP